MDKSTKRNRNASLFYFWRHIEKTIGFISFISTFYNLHDSSSKEFHCLYVHILQIDINRKKKLKETNRPLWQFDSDIVMIFRHSP